MLYQLSRGYVEGYTDGQGPLIYLVTHAQTIAQSGKGFVFSDGHGIAMFTHWFDNLRQLDRVDWPMVYADYWEDTLEDGDRKRRKQAEFLVHKFLDWSLISSISVLNTNTRVRVEGILAQHPGVYHPTLDVRPNWYYR